MVRVHHYVNPCAASFVQDAGVVALEQGEPYVQEMVREYDRRRQYAVRALNEIDGIRCTTPEGAFYIFVNIKEFGKTSAEMADYLLDEAKVASVPGSAFGAEGEGCIRISYACAYDRIVDGIQRIKDACAKL